MPVFLNDQLPWSHLYSKTPPSSGRQPDPATSCCMERLAAYAAQRQEGWARRRQTLSRWSTFFRVEVRQKGVSFRLICCAQFSGLVFCLPAPRSTETLHGAPSNGTLYRRCFFPKRENSLLREWYGVLATTPTPRRRFIALYYCLWSVCRISFDAKN